MSVSRSINRRAFLATAATIGVAGAVYQLLGRRVTHPELKTGTRLRAGHFHYGPGMNSAGLYLADGYKSRAVFEWDFETGKTRKYDTQTAIHVVETSPVDENISVLATKFTERMSIFDWSSEKEISTHQLAHGSFFYGHAVFTSDGNFILAAAIDRSSNGSIEVFEVPSLKRVGSHPVERGSIHEIIHIADSKFLFCTGNTSTTPPAFGIFDLATTEFQYFDVPMRTPDETLSMIHLKDCGDRYVANVNILARSGVLDGAVVSLDKTNLTVKNEIPFGSLGQLSQVLSFEYDFLRARMWITFPDQNLIVVWNLASDTLAKKIQIYSPLSVSFSASLDIVVVASTSQFFSFDPTTLERRESFDAKAPNKLLTGGKSSHSRMV